MRILDCLRRNSGIVKPIAVTALLAFSSAKPAASAEFVLDFYSGMQSAPHSRVSGDDPAGVGSFSFLAGWEGKPFQMPPHYGFRGIWMTTSSFGWFADFNHTKLYPDSATIGATGTSGFEVLEFTDGLNNLTFGPFWSFENASIAGMIPYVAPGIGVALPHVEVQTQPGAPRTFEYQFGGPNVSLAVGVAKPLANGDAITIDYKFTYTALDVDLTGGGHLQSNVITNAINIGYRFKF